MSLVGLVLVGSTWTDGYGLPQAQQTEPTLRLTVRPRQMTIAKSTEDEGEFSVDGISGYVPKQCVGARRCPLMLASNFAQEFYGDFAEKYGVIVVELDIGLMMKAFNDTTSAAKLDRVVKVALENLAIDPNRIAIVGRCATGPETAAFGGQNPEVFNRIAVFTQHTGDPLPKTPGRNTEYYIAGALMGEGGNFAGVHMLRERGYTVKHVLPPRYHAHQYEDNDLMGHWLIESWKIPNPAARPKPVTVTTLPLLTPEALAQMTAFWTRFGHEPDSIQRLGRRARVREVVVPVGKERISTLMVNMAALAARYPSVAAALKAAGLTPSQHDAYRAALVSAHVVLENRKSKAPGRTPVELEPYSVQAKNVAFLDTYRDEARALEEAGMWTTP